MHIQRVEASEEDIVQINTWLNIEQNAIKEKNRVLWERKSMEACGLEWRTRDNISKELVREPRLEDEVRQTVQGGAFLTEEEHI